MPTARKVKGLAVTAARRLPALPDVPSITELPGFKDLAMTAWIESPRLRERRRP